MKTINRITTCLAVLAAAVLTSCSEEKIPVAKEIEFVHLGNEERFLLEDSMAAIFDETLYEINENLALIAEKKGSISFGPGSPNEAGISTKEQVVRNIQVINSLVDQNKKKINNLTAELKEYKMENSSLYALIEKAEKRQEDYEKQIEAMKIELLARDYDIDALNRRVDYLQVKTEILQTEADAYRVNLAKAYYLCEDKKSLKKQGVLVQKGGVLGIGKTSMLNASVADHKFTEIDINKNTSIPIQGDKPELITEHPEGSYEFKKENNMTTYLHINNPEKFWKTTKYMVVAVR